MRVDLAVLRAGFRAECVHLRRTWAILVLILLQAVGFLLLMSMFALTGSMAPTALVVQQPGPLTEDLAASLAACHHSFALVRMGADDARKALAHGEVAAVLTLHAGLEDTIGRGGTATVRLDVDNINADMTEDLKRALPSAVVAFGHAQHFPAIRLRVEEQDMQQRDTGFADYLLVSSLMLDAFLIAAVLGALPISREAEAGTMRLLRASPFHPLVPLGGRLVAAGCVSCCAMVIPTMIVVLGFGTHPVHPVELVADLALCVAVFTACGAAAGACVKSSMAATCLIGSLTLPMYLCSNALEPQRFDGEAIWLLAHASPAYFAVGLLEHAFHDFRVTPEPLACDATVLMAWGMAALVFLFWRLGRARMVAS
jgi:ABC-2 type transport system permease protein